jgi:signal transduction histidine kinase/DNA-binding response OmpR family regulator
MANNDNLKEPEFWEAFLANEREVRISTGRLACALVFVLMPLGIVLDYFVYPEHLVKFLELRLLCSLLVIVIWSLHSTSIARKHYPVVGLFIVILPAFFITWMVYETGSASPYYAGLNLILLAVSAVGHWSMLETFLAVSIVILMYLASCVFKGLGTERFGAIFNNLYFLVLTGIIVVCGNRLFNQLRFREFTLRFELNKNRQELEETNRKLVELDRLKSRFFANISHELRTPLTLLLSPLETLLQRFASKMDNDVHDLLLTMHSNGMRLLKLINDLLDLIRLEAGRMEVKSEPMEVADFIKGLASAARQVAEDKHIKLETYTDLRLGVVAADADKMEKVVLNLLFNALKFTPANGRVELRAEKQGEELVFIVSDTGIGIAEKNLPFVFDRFWQADSSAQRKYQGVGIGLALVKELTDMMRGSVVVESQEGKGTTFTVRLPYLKAELPPKPQPGAATGTGVVASEEWLINLYRRAELFPAMASLRGAAKPVELGKRGRRPVALVADDEPDMRRFLRSQLDQDYDVLEAADGLQAMEKATQFLPDIILLDMMMPEMDGLAVCRELRKREDTAAVPIILLTARADEETKFNALELGANDFLAKPFSSTELHARIKNLVESTIPSASSPSKTRPPPPSTNSRKRNCNWCSPKARLARPHERGHHPRNQQSAEFRHDRPVCPAQQRQTSRARDNARIRGNPQRHRGGHQTRAQHRLRFAHVHASRRRTGGTGGCGRGGEHLAAVSRRRMEGQGAVELKVVPEHQIVLASRNKLIHVLVNLLQNSLDAMREKKFEASRRRFG